MSRFKTAATPLSRHEIVEAALGHARAGDLADLSVRRLAAELDVTPMALYRHVRDKDDLLEAVTDALLAEVGLPGADLPWDAYLAALAGSLRQVLEAQPAVMELYTRRAILGPMAVARLTGARTVLEAAGWSGVEANQRVAAVHTYTLGFCALEAARQRTRSPAEDLTADQRVIAEMVSVEQFDRGLRALIQGLGPAPG